MTDQLFINKQDSPFFFYDIDALQSHLHSINQLSGEKIRLFYATKANPLLDVLRTVHSCGLGIDVASNGELSQAIKAGFKGDQIIATGPSKSKKYLQTLIENNISTLVLESPNQALWANEIALEKNITIDCLLRVQLEWEKGSSVLGGNEITPFGLGKNDWNYSELKNYKNLNILGLHIFQWGNLTSTEKICEIWNQIIETVCEISKFLEIKKPILDLGGGLGLDYGQTDITAAMKAIDIDVLFKFLNSKIVEKNFTEIWLELGRFAVGAFGYYFHRIIDKKMNRGVNQLICESGINHLIRPTLTNCPFPAVVVGKNKDSVEYNVYGPLCTALDKLGTYKFPKNTEIGDWIQYFLVGAYGMTESMPYFLCHDLPAEFIKKNGQISCVRQSSPPQTWMK
ncbi:MAG: PLP-dependent decarboxylase [Halobacteriovoraceae bacterium]|nr:PLP-dependent decarboxylase [Halobacteriovoraceae bacterium]